MVSYVAMLKDELLHVFGGYGDEELIENIVDYLQDEGFFDSDILHEIYSNE